MESEAKSVNLDGSYRASSFIGSSVSSKKQLLQDLYTASLMKKQIVLLKRRKTGQEIANSNINMLPQFVVMLQSDQTRHQGLVNIRILSQNEKSNDIIVQSIIDAHLVPILIDYIIFLYPEEIQIEASWIIANISSGTNMQNAELIERKIIPIIAHSIVKKDISYTIKENMIYTLSNIIIGDCFAKNLVLDDPNLLANTISLLTDPNLDIISSRAILDLAHTSPEPPYSYFSVVYPLPSSQVISSVSHSMPTLKWKSLKISWARLPKLLIAQIMMADTLKTSSL